MRIAITPGEPAGIGPDLLIQYVQQPLQHQLVCIGDKYQLQQRAQQLGLPLQLHDHHPDQVSPCGNGHLPVLHTPLANIDACGTPDPANAPALLQALQHAVTGCLDNTFAALVTGPLHKGVINDAGIPFTGHTEFLAEQSATEQVVMMLAAPESVSRLRVALATTHLPLKDVSAAITRPGLTRTLQILHQDLQHHFGIQQPRILVCGLNPHAGEGGHLGDEEIRTIIPVLEKLQTQGLNLQGPLPADTAFTAPYLQQADAVVAMYHDQGLPVLKHLGFGHAVNITLGLPFIRTSVDHGTALPLAGSGKADTGSLHTAITTAVQMAHHAAGVAHGA